MSLAGDAQKSHLSLKRKLINQSPNIGFMTHLNLSGQSMAPTKKEIPLSSTGRNSI